METGFARANTRNTNLHPQALIGKQCCVHSGYGQTCVFEWPFLH